MPKSSRHKSHKQSKHNSRDYSDSDEDLVKTKEKRSRESVSTRGHRDSTSGDKRKTSSLLREGKDNQDLSGNGNGDLMEEYVSSKRRKEKADVSDGGDRWNGGEEERIDSERHVEKESHKGESLKVDVKLKENNSKGESLRVESKSKSKRHDSGIAGDRKEDSLVYVVEKEENKTKGESKRKSERDSSLRKEGKESKDKDHRLVKEKNGGQESKTCDAEVKSVDMDVGKKKGTQLVDLSGEKQSRRSRENNAERSSLEELKNPGLDKDIDKKLRKKIEGSSEIEKYYDEPKDSDGKQVSSKGDRTKDSKHRDGKPKDGGYPDKYQDDGHKDDRRRDDKYWEEVDKEHKHHSEKYREVGERDSRRRGDRNHGDGDRDSRRKDEKQRDDVERVSRRKNDKYHEVTEREDKYHEDSDKDYKHKDDRNHEDGEKDTRHVDEKYYDDGDRDDRRRDNSYRDDGERDYRHKDEKYCEDMEREVRYKDSKQGDGFDREKRPRDSKYRDERGSRDRAGDKSEPKRSRDEGYATDNHVRKSSAYDDSPTRDDRATKHRDDQGRRRTIEKEDYSEVKSRGTKDQRSDAEKKSAGSARMDPATDRVRSTSKNVDMELTSGHSRRRSSPSSSSHAPRDNYRAAKQDDSKYRDYNYEDRSRHNINSARDYSGPVGGSDKNSSSRPLDKLGQKDNAHFGESPTERRLKSDIRSPPLKLLEKSPSSSFDRRQFNRPEIRRNIDVDESTKKSGGSRDWKDYSTKDVQLAEELVPVDADVLSVSSPFGKTNHHLSSNSKSFPAPPPSFRTGGVDTPSLLGSGEDEGRSGKPNIRHRRMGDHNMGRMQGNKAWRGVPSWPSPVPNGFLPFPHASPFHSVMQPFHAPPMFGVRPPMELSHHHSPYHMTPDTDRFSGPGRPMGWRNQVDDSCPPPQLHGWDTSNAIFGDESHIYGRSEWDHSRNMSGGRGWDRTGNLDLMPSSEKENNNNSIRSGDEETLGGQSVHQTPQNAQTRVDQQSDSISDVAQSTKSFGNNEIGDPVIVSSGDSGDVGKVSRNDDVPFCHFYLSKLDISTELAESELYDKCTGSIDMDKIMCSGIDDSKILYMEDVEKKMSSPGLLSFALFASTDDSVFKKSVSLYKIQREKILAEYGEKSEVIPNSDKEDKNVQENKIEKLFPTDSIHVVEDETETLEEKIEGSTGKITTENHKETISSLDLQMHDAEDKPLPEEGSDAPLGHAKDVPMGPTCINNELDSLDTKYGPLLNSDVSSEASEAMMPESVNLSRIHHSPESTH